MGHTVLVRLVLSAVRFAESFTHNMDTLGRQYPSIAELQGLFRLYDLMRHLRDVGQTVVPDMDYWVSQYVHPYEGPPSAMPKTPVTRKIRARVGNGYETQTWTFR